MSGRHSGDTSTASRNTDAASHNVRDDTPPPARLRLLSFKSVVKGALRGFASVELPSGLRITDCPVMVGSNGAWATLPGKPILDAEGRQVETNGKKQFVAFAQWRDRDLQRRFSDAVIALVKAEHGQLDGGDQ
jgi:DNA-binding cell septation regulator SpoVG